MWIQFRPDKDVWAFGVEPAKVKFRLRLARYPALAESLKEWLARRDKVGEAITQPVNPEPLALVDIGAGFGRTFLYLEAADIANRFDLLGLDIDPERKDDVYDNNPYRIIGGDANKPLDLVDASFDVVVSEQLLEHLDKPDQLITEFHRIMKQDGLLVVGVPIFPEPIAMLRRALVRRFGLRGSDHIQTYSLRSIRRDLAPYFEEVEARGFRIISGGLLRNLENYEWWYRFNRRLGRWLPGLCIEVQLLLRPRPKSEH
ncbi:MAG: methyltransferase domain-containing protein [Pseudomonadales bacterium]|nr:methyltransferase domain-containing protein [Pseudomonadales bacterium]